MTASEFGFLALGLVLGIVSGAAIVEFVRARPPAPREVRLTVSHDAIPRRAATLADDAFTSAGPEPARGGPADRRLIDGDSPVGEPDRRTTVRFEPGTTTSEPTIASVPGAIPIIRAPAEPIPGAIPIVRAPAEPTPGTIMQPALPLTGHPPTDGDGPSALMVGIPISSGEDPMLVAINRSRPVAVGVAVPGAAATSSTAVAVAPPLRRTAIATAVVVDYDPPPTMAATPEPEPDRVVPPARPPAAKTRPGIAVATISAAVAQLGPPASTAAGPGSAPVDTERCADERRIAAERCELATLARARADSAADALRLAQRTYDEHEAAAVTASWRADPRAVHESKDAAQGDFRSAVGAAATPDALEDAARDWLNAINRINTDAREATTTAASEHAAAAAIGATLERLGLEADAARIGAENADAACLAARVIVADCDELTTSEGAAVIVAAVPSPSTGLFRLEEDETLGQALAAGGAPRIFRLLRGDRQAMTSLVAILSDADAEARRRWQLLMTGLVEAIIADAIEASAFEFPEDHPFWGMFTRVQARDIANALSSLGYRFDGLGGWLDERLPSQRDLSLALGYAGLDPMRIRRWPTVTQTAGLYRGVTVVADEYLAGIAGDMTLAEMVAMLGRRADGLAEVWNHWGRIRPLLLDEG